MSEVALKKIRKTVLLCTTDGEISVDIKVYNNKL
jgi:hypothetical protein